MEIVQIIITLIIITALSILTYGIIKKDGNPWTNIFVKNENIFDKTTPNDNSINNNINTYANAKTHTNTFTDTTNNARSNTNAKVPNDISVGVDADAYTITRVSTDTSTNANANARTNANTRTNTDATEILGELGNSRRVCFELKCPSACCPPCPKNECECKKKKKKKCCKSERPCRTMSSRPIIHRCACQSSLCNRPRRCGCSIPQPWGYDEWEY